MMTAHESTGTNAPPGTRNGTPPAFTFCLRSWSAASEHAKYASSAATFAMIASEPNVLVIASVQAIADWTAIET